jgi:GNAT superfamily N-acetyltransferase
VAERGGEVVGFLNSVASHAPDLADEELKALVGHDPGGAHLVILSVAVRPDLQGQGLSRPLLERFLAWAREEGKESVLLLCKARLIPYYQRFGFEDRGLSASAHGGFAWHEMGWRP